MPRGFSVNDPMPRFFPTGALVDVCAALVVGLVGAVIGPKLSRDPCNSLNLIFGARFMAMGISYIVKLETPPALMLAIIVGMSAGTSSTSRAASPVRPARCRVRCPRPSKPSRPAT